MPACRPEDVHRRFAEAMNAGDLKALAELYPAPRAGGATAHKGHEALRDLLALKPQISVETRSVVRTGKVALLGSRWRLAGTTPEGRAITLSGKGTEMVQRQADGSWRYVVEPQAASGLLH
jgi:ketosteroid isomerase-like protein